MHFMEIINAPTRSIINSFFFKTFLSISAFIFFPKTAHQRDGFTSSVQYLKAVTGWEYRFATYALSLCIQYALKNTV